MCVHDTGPFREGDNAGAAVLRMSSVCCASGLGLQVRHMLASHGRLHEVTQVILNPSDEPYFNVISTMSNKEDVKVGERGSSCRPATAAGMDTHRGSSGLARPPRRAAWWIARP